MLVQGKYYRNTTAQNMGISANNSGNDRIDLLVARSDYVAQEVRLVILEGTPGVTPARPTLTQDSGVTWEVPIVKIDVANGVLAINNADITYEAQWSHAADALILTDVLNNSGGDLEANQMLIWDSTANNAVTTTTLAGNDPVAGVCQGFVSNGQSMNVLLRGFGYLDADGAVTRGDYLKTSTTAGKVTVSSYRLGAFALALETTTGAGQVFC